MNRPPETFQRVSADAMRSLVEQLGRAAGLPGEKAALLAELLTANDLRGVFSHGTVQMSTYVRLLRDGVLNAQPSVQVVRETPVSVLVDGDGGLGYFPAIAATDALIEKAKSQGMAVALTRNHGHFGAAGIYARRTQSHDLLCFVTSGHQLQLTPGDSILRAAGGSPMAFSSPADTEVSLTLDFGTMHDLYEGSPYLEAIARLAPGIVFRGIGLGAVCQSWGGFLAGLPSDPARAQRVFSGANQGSLVMAFRIDLFADPAVFKQEMDAYVRGVRQMRPVRGFAESFLPGGIEAAREAEYRAEGIPVGPEHRARLGEVAAELGLSVPWR